MADVCASCGVSLSHLRHVTFECPECGEEEISRCVRCRQQGNSYVCDSCGFEGP